MSSVTARLILSRSPHSIPPNRSLNSLMITDSRSVSGLAKSVFRILCFSTR